MKVGGKGLWGREEVFKLAGPTISKVLEFDHPADNLHNAVVKHRM